MPENVLGHSDIAPFRKIDPGEKFPWHELNRKELSYLPKISHINENLSEADENKQYAEFQKILEMLGFIGYDTRGVNIRDNKFQLLIKAYQRHYRQSDISGEIDQKTTFLIKQHFKDVLTFS